MQSKPVRALYIGYTKGTENLGDEALIWIIRDLLAPEIEVVTEGEDYDVALLGGGTLINQAPWLIDHFAGKLKKAGRGVVFGTGVGDLAFWGNHFDQWVPLLQQCEAVGVRGPMSTALLKEHGLVTVEDVGDPFLWLQPPVLREPVEKHLGVNVGSTNNSLWGTKDEALCVNVAEALRELEKAGWTFTFVSVWDKDLPLLDEVRGLLKGHGRYPVLNARTQTLETFSALASCQVFLGEKLHANAMAAVTGTPFVSLEYQPKVRDFAASLDMEHYVLSTADCAVETVLRHLEKAAGESGALREKLRMSHAARRASILDYAAKVKRLLGTPDRM